MTWEAGSSLEETKIKTHTMLKLGHLSDPKRAKELSKNNQGQRVINTFMLMLTFMHSLLVDRAVAATHSWGIFSRPWSSYICAKFMYY